MTTKLTDEQREALRETGGPVEVQDDQSNKVYILSEEEMFRRAMLALQQQEDLTAIQAGIAAMERGDVITLEELDARIRSRLGLPVRGT